MKKTFISILLLLLASTGIAAVANWGGNTFTGLHSDTKPTNVPDGSRFFETESPYGVYVKSGGVWNSISAVGTSAVYTAATMTVNTGTLVSGTVSDLWSVDSGSVIIDESTGADPLRVTFSFTGVASINNIRVRAMYNTSDLDHSIAIELYNKTTALWDQYGTIDYSTGWVWYSEPIFNGANYIDNGTVLLRLRHIETGKNWHALSLDYVVVQQGSAGGGITNHASLPDILYSGHPASIIAFTPASGLSSTNTQSAIGELAARTTGTNTGDQSYVASAGTASTALALNTISQCYSHVTSTATGTTAVVTLLTCTIPGGSIGPNGSLYAIPLWTSVSSTWSKIGTVKLNGSTILSVAWGGYFGYRPILQMVNMGSESSQALITNGLMGPLSSSSDSNLTLPTQSDMTLTVTCQLSNASEFCALKFFYPWILKP